MHQIGQTIELASSEHILHPSFDLSFIQRQQRRLSQQQTQRSMSESLIYGESLV